MEIENNQEIEDFDWDKIDFHKLLFLLRINYSYIASISESFYTSPIYFKDLRLNYCYINLLNKINIILKMKGFEELKKEMPPLYEDLISNMDDVGIVWECGYDEMINKFQGCIEKKFINSGCKVYRLQSDMENFYKRVDTAVKEFKQQSRSIFDGMLNKMEKQSGLTKVKPMSEESNNDILKYGNIVLDLTEEATLQYKENDPIEIQPDNKEIKFLKILIKNKGKISKYLEIAEKIGLNCYYEGIPSEKVSREVQFSKRDLGKVSDLRTFTFLRQVEK